MENFQKLISPSKLSDFARDNWTTMPHLAVKDSIFGEIISVEEIDDYLSTNRLSFPFVKVIAKDGKVLGPENYVNDMNDRYSLINRKGLFSYYSLGHTLVLQAAHLTFKNLQMFTRALEKETNMRFHANIYITPPSSKGFNPHFDGHEVFVIQIGGTKEWNLYDMPYLNPGKGTGLTAEDRERYVSGEPQHRIRLSEGDVLYVPRGVVHDAYTTNSTSIHVTLGVHPIQGIDLLRSVEQKLATNVFFTGYVQSLSQDFSVEEWKKVAIKEIAAVLDQNVASLAKRKDPIGGERHYLRDNLFYQLIVLDSIEDYSDAKALSMDIMEICDCRDSNRDNPHDLSIVDQLRSLSEIESLSVPEIKQQLKKLLVEGAITIGNL